MKEWLRRIRGAVGMGLIWGAGWGAVGLLIALFLDPHGAIDDAWVATLGIPGFLSGVVFSAVLRIAEGRRGFHELSVPQVGAWGALAGLLLGVLPFVLGTPTAALPPWLLGLVTVVPITVLSAVSASASLAIARKAEDGGRLERVADRRKVVGAGGEAEELGDGR